jgi:hypothetical protein
MGVLATILRTRNDRRTDRWFYTAVHSLMMGQTEPKHVGVCILKDICNSNELCDFAGHIVTIVRQ